MTSVLTTNPDRVELHSVTARDRSARLSLKPRSPASGALGKGALDRGALDGAWWPRSTDPTIELAALIAAVGDQRAPVRRIALNMSGWDSAPRRIRLDSGRKVAVDWFQTSGVHLVRTLGTDDRRTDLLIIPADTTPATAHRALTMATDGHDPDIN
jgi:uncharacterized protein DUF5994